MDENEKQKYEASAQELRAELKRFEGDWAKQNGTKPAREDIKNNPDIAQKYKQYNQVRDILAGKVQPPKPKEPKEASRSRKRQPEGGVIQTPSKRSRPAQTPSKSRRRNEEEEEISFETPLRRLFSPTMPTSIGPTPQKDGRVLGLFDLLEENNENTPSKNRSHEPSEENVQVQATPSKKRVADDDSDDVDNIKLGRTPMSSSKRAILNTFMTPLKSRDNNAVGGKTPTSVSKLQFATPSFLRRTRLPSVDEDGGYKSPPLRLPRKPLGRSLSSVVASLRKIEEEKLDDDLEALHEMENGNTPARKPPAESAKPSNDVVLEPDSQRPQLLGGFDDEALYDSPTEEALGRDGLPLRVYKKKGQKRTTRRVNMKPTRSKRPQQTEEEDAEDGEADTVPETQHDATKPTNSDPLDLGSDSDFDDEAEEEEESKEKSQRKKQPKKGAEKKASEDGKAKKTAKKINANAMAHSNFKRLKLKNHGAKGGPGVNSRFRRRR